jgi:hypothetical protein
MHLTCRIVKCKITHKIGLLGRAGADDQLPGLPSMISSSDIDTGRVPRDTRLITRACGVPSTSCAMLPTSTSTSPGGCGWPVREKRPIKRVLGGTSPSLVLLGTSPSGCDCAREARLTACVRGVKSILFETPRTSAEDPRGCAWLLRDPRLVNCVSTIPLP